MTVGGYILDRVGSGDIPKTNDPRALPKAGPPIEYFNCDVRGNIVRGWQPFPQIGQMPTLFPPMPYFLAFIHNLVSLLSTQSPRAACDSHFTYQAYAPIEIPRLYVLYEPSNFYV